MKTRRLLIRGVTPLLAAGTLLVLGGGGDAWACGGLSRASGYTGGYRSYGSTHHGHMDHGYNDHGHTGAGHADHGTPDEAPLEDGSPDPNPVEPGGAGGHSH